MRLQYAGLHIGRVLLASLFILGGINKMLNFETTAATMTGMGFPLVPFILPATIALEFGGGMAVAVGRAGAAVSALLLFVYTIVVNSLFHRFWEVGGDAGQAELSLFFKNISVAGGMLYLAASLPDLNRRGQGLMSRKVRDRKF
ncbi:DoxX family protein [uncultured Roseobacter sp.]|uniref:DoxX family protein n=1 Tax=uncultured Roseobacter sp. TaxID=114847 RepID=UPI00260F4873|nr:DoxX family protein [uncultured Roseobacter sp.]